LVIRHPRTYGLFWSILWVSPLLSSISFSNLHNEPYDGIIHHFSINNNSLIFWTERDPWLSLPTICSTPPTAVDVHNIIARYPGTATAYHREYTMATGTTFFFFFALRPTGISTYRYGTLSLKFNRVPVRTDHVTSSTCTTLCVPLPDT